MSLKKIGQIKDGKWFRIWDAVVYGVIAVIVVALFVAVFLTRDGSPADGVKVTGGGVTVFEYDYKSGKYKVFDSDKITVIADNGSLLELKFIPEGGRGYNNIVIDKKNRSVKVTDADCSIRKDCVYTPAVTDNSHIICCPPHSMTIEPLKRVVKDDDDIIIG